MIVSMTGNDEAVSNSIIITILLRQFFYIKYSFFTKWCFLALKHGDRSSNCKFERKKKIGTKIYYFYVRSHNF